MQPHEIKPDTLLCTIVGYNAQTGQSRKYFNKILKNADLNATAIALNITDEHFAFTMQNVANSKVDKMIIEHEFGVEGLQYCKHLNETAKVLKSIDFIEVENKEIFGYSLEEEAKALFTKPELVDASMLLAAKMMILANRWYGVKIDVDEIPVLLGE